MWKPWRNNSIYEIPSKPQSLDDRVSMIWDFVYNHLPGRLNEQDRKITWQDHKINFILILVAILVGCFGKMAFS